MTTLSVTAICNQALVDIGYPERIASVLDGSKESRAIVTLYGETRDELIREQDWAFTLRTAALSLIATVSPTNGAALGFPYTYGWPADCIRLRAVIPTTLPFPDDDPSWVRFEVYDDPTHGRVILTAQATAQGVYAAQIIDMTQWDPLFTRLLTARLGRRLVPLLGNIQIVPAAERGAMDARADALGASETQAPSNVVIRQQASQ